REGLRQALANLLDNALKFTRQVDQPTITIRGTEGEAERVLSVSDDGVGFDPKYSEKAFAMFQRLHPQEEYEGTGIGLAIVKKVAERHGGRAWATSELGKGSTFYLAIPTRNADCGMRNVE
ncbi:MAG: GHKL domain-containing protein, partial [candidate division NC10 bacterium]|nr:GHKL domain-containing protein [candidate division NC10 bacterium]